MENIEEIRDILSFGDNEVHVLLAITRNKENENVTANSRSIHRNIVREEDELEDGIEHLQKICQNEEEDFRIYISVNSRDVTKAAYLLRSKINDVSIQHTNGNDSAVRYFKKLDSEFRSILQLEECRSTRKFLFDLDSTSKSDVEEFIDQIEVVDPELTIDTPNGHHVVTEPFHFTQDFDSIDVEKKTDGMVFIGYLD
jgi:hypothetical protein